VKIAGLTRRMPLDEAAPAGLRDAFATFQSQATAEFHAMSLDGALAFTLSADMRFVGQAFEIPVEIDPGLLPHLTAADLAERFTAAHRRVYFHGGEPGRRVEIVGLRLGVRRPLDALPEFRERRTTLGLPETTPVRVGADTLPARMVAAAALRPDTALPGPALIEGYSSSLWVPPSWTARRDPHGNIIMRRAS
jgi:N-methylhydantoinase A